MTENTNRPMVGTCAVIKHNDHILLGYRCGKHAPNLWACPGGHLEYGEHPFEAVIRETKEEANIDVEIDEDFDMGWSSNVWENENKHYITLYIRCRLKEGCSPEDVVNMEPHKLKDWTWFHVDNLPDNMMHDCMKEYLRK